MAIINQAVSVTNANNNALLVQDLIIVKFANQLTI